MADVSHKVFSYAEGGGRPSCVGRWDGWRDLGSLVLCAAAVRAARMEVCEGGGPDDCHRRSPCRIPAAKPLQPEVRAVSGSDRSWPRGAAANVRARRGVGSCQRDERDEIPDHHRARVRMDTAKRCPEGGPVPQVRREGQRYCCRSPPPAKPARPCRGWVAAGYSGRPVSRSSSARHPRLVEGPGGPQPEREDDGGGCGDTAGVVTGQQARAEMTEPVQAEAEECVLIEGRTSVCPVAVHGGSASHFRAISHEPIWFRSPARAGHAFSLPR